MEKITTGYSELRILFSELGIKFTDDGDATSNLNGHARICIKGDGGVTLTFKIDGDANEFFVRQE